MDNTGVTAGTVYVAGYTNSLNFPQGGAANNYDAFVATLSAAGALSKAVLYGGPGVDQATSIALDYSTFSGLATATNVINPATDPNVVPNVVIGGFTSGGISPKPDGFQPTFRTCENNGFPTSGGNCGNIDGFIATFTKPLVLLHATYLGGGGNDQVNGVAADVGGNIYATGFATPDVLGCGIVAATGQCPSNVTSPGALPNLDIASDFPVINGLGTDLVYDNSFGGGGTFAVPFVAKFACMSAGPVVGIPSAPPAIPTCNGSNNLKTLEHSALFGGSGHIINPQQTEAGQQGITEAGLAIAVDLDGLYPAEVAIIENRTRNDGDLAITAGGAGFTIPGNDIVPKPDFSATSTTGIVGGFQPGLAGPRVYVVGATGNTNFSRSLTTASCTNAPNFVPGSGSKAIPPLCPVPPVTGGVSPSIGGYPVPEGGGAKAAKGQTQGWLVSFQFPAVTQAVVTVAGSTSLFSALTPPCSGDANPFPNGADSPYLPGVLPGAGPLAPTPFAGPNPTTCIVTTLQPPTIPNYVVLQPPTCPGWDNGVFTPVNTSDTNCVQGYSATNVTIADAELTCTNGATGITCPTAFIGAWTGVAVDTGQQVYVIGQVGMSNPPVIIGAPTPGVWGVGLANRLALEIERIDPFGNPEFIFPCPVAFGTCTGPVTSSYVIDTTNGLGNIFGQILPGAPPSPDPNQPGGLSAAIAVNTLREAFFVGTTTDVTPDLTANTAATVSLTITGGVVTIVSGSTKAGTGYTSKQVPSPPVLAISGVTGCTSTPALGVTLSGGGLSFSLTTPAPASNGTASCTGTPTVTVPAPPAVTNASSPNYLTQSPILELSVLPTPASQFQMAGAACVDNSKVCIQNASADTAKTGSGPEDVIYGAIQFYDAIATPAVLNFSTTVNGIVPTSKLINFTDWQGLPLNVPPGCVVTFNTTSANGYFTATPVFGVSQWQIAPVPGQVGTPGVFTAYLEWDMTGPCAGTNQPPLELTAFDRVLATLTVSAPLNLSPQNTFVLTSKLSSGLIDQYVSQGVQLVANQQIIQNIGVTTASSNGPINFTVQIVPGPNWTGSVTQAVTVPVATGNIRGATDIIYEAPGQGTAPQAQIPVTVNTNIIEGLPIGTYTAFILFTASPATPVTPAAVSVLCNPLSSPLATLPPATGTTTPSCIPISITIVSAPQGEPPITVVFGSQNTTAQQTSFTLSNPLGAAGPYNFTAGYIADNFYGSPLPANNVFFIGTGTTLISANGGFTTGSIASGGQFSIPIVIDPTKASPGYPNGLVTGVYAGELLASNNGQASGATPQTTVPILVYVGPLGTVDAPSNNGLGLMFPPNSPFLVGGIGGCPISYPPPPSAQVPNPCPPPGASTTPGSYPITVSVPAGYNPSQLAQQQMITGDRAE